MAVFHNQSAGDRAFIDAILQGQPMTPSLYDGFKVQQVIDAAIASHQSGRWVSVA
jgi:predicted dehydrogenase